MTSKPRAQASPPGDAEPPLIIRPVKETDLAGLVALEQMSFASDRLSKRRFQHWIKADHRLFLVAQLEDRIVGYGLVFLHRGTRLARLYSLAIDQTVRGRGIGRRLLSALEEEAADLGRLHMRLEVATDNESAIRLYDSTGYRQFGIHVDYYENHADALRMQKCIRHPENPPTLKQKPWFQQTTPFTCGPAALMMAMASLDERWQADQSLELALWREATTIFMTSGHGGCHPIGLALAAQRRNFRAMVWVNRSGTLFIDGVRSADKKQIMRLVDQQFREEARESGLEIHEAELTQSLIAEWLAQGAAVLVLISTYRLDSKRAPHWVFVTAIDEECLYVHDPDPAEGSQTALDCQHIPIAREDFHKMAAFGRDQLRTAVILWPEAV